MRGQALGPLQRRFRDDVSSQVRSNGELYFRQGRVSEMEFVSDGILGAFVRGTRTYSVTLRRTAQQVIYECSCPYYQQNETCCKHVWATLLAAENTGLLTDWELDSPSFDAEFTGENEPDDFDDSAESDDDDGDGDDDDAPRVSGPINEHLIRTASTAPKRTADWKRQLDHVRAQMRSQEPVSEVIWPAGREIVYVIDVARTLTGGGLALELAQRDRKKDGTWTKLRRESIGDAVIKQLPDAIDREILSMLFGADDDSSGYFTGYYQTASRFRLSRIQLVPILSRACQTGRALFEPAAKTETRNSPRPNGTAGHHGNSSSTLPRTNPRCDTSLAES